MNTAAKLADATKVKATLPLKWVVWNLMSRPDYRPLRAR